MPGSFRHGIWIEKRPDLVSQQRKNQRRGRPVNFQTSAEDVAPLFPHIPLNRTIWEPACGEGQIVRAFEDAGYSVKGTDVLQGFDFLAPLATTDFGFDCIVTNPPYSKKDDWLERCFETGKPFALLLPNYALGGQRRCALYQKHGIELLVLPWRPTFTTPNGTVGGSWFPVSWFCHGLGLPKQITFATKS